MDARQVFRLSGALRDGHFVYKSGRHGGVYVNKDAVFSHPRFVDVLAAQIAKTLRDVIVDVVAGPAIGGAILAQVVGLKIAGTLGTPDAKGVPRVVFAEKDGDLFVLRRGYDQLVRGKRVLAVEDIFTTGGSCKRMIKAVRAAGGTVVAVRALWNRGGVTAEDLGVEDFGALINTQFKDYSAEECPLCTEGVPINMDVGHGVAFIAQHGQPQKK